MRGHVLLEPGQMADTVYFPSSAVVSVATVMEDGRAVESNTIGRETAVGLLNAMIREPMTSRVFVQVGGAGLSLSASAFRQRVAQSPVLNQLALRHIYASLAQAEQFVACNALHVAEARIARWLIMTADRTGAMRSASHRNIWPSWSAYSARPSACWRRNSRPKA